MKKRWSLLTAVFLFLGIFIFSPPIASATILNSNLTADNEFWLYISTNDAVTGNLVGYGNNWGTTYSFNTALTPYVTNYIHVYAVDWGGPEGLLGSFSLNDTGFSFVNASQSLTTNTVDWNVNSTGFGNPYNTPVSYGLNGVSPWGFHPSINSGAKWIWNPSGSSYAYFSTAISPASQPVPEPATLLLLGCGLAGFGLWRIKKR